MEFTPFPKIGRLSRDCIITEKLDGTNACVAIGEDGSFKVASRTRWITPDADNFGFAKWAYDNEVELRKLGPGRHFGEWWGLGIQRGYGLAERRFSLFNVHRWGDPASRPKCCGVVPTLGVGNFDTAFIAQVMNDLRTYGSHAVPGFGAPEGVVIFHTQSGAMFKKTFEKDDAGKGKEPEREMV